MKNIYRCRICGTFTEEPVHCGKEAELLLDGSRRLALSKLMSYLLRHDPASVGLKMDREGWVSISELVKAIKERWRNAHLYRWVREEHVIAIASLDPKGRFEIKNGFIRARYGHNKKLEIAIEYEEDRQSVLLYHGTSSRVLRSILSEGIKPMNRMFVHLSTSLKDACEVGKRHDHNPIVLVIDANCLRKQGIAIYLASKSVRIAKYVPPQCISKVVSCRE